MCPPSDGLFTVIESGDSGEASLVFNSRNWMFSERWFDKGAEIFWPFVFILTRFQFVWKSLEKKAGWNI